MTTYEVKQFPHWSVDAVYEAASDHRFSHEAYVVLEWPKDLDFSITDPTYKVDQLARDSFRQIHVPSGQPIKQLKGVRDGDEFTPVPEEEIIKGYEKGITS